MAEDDPEYFGYLCSPPPEEPQKSLSATLDQPLPEMSIANFTVLDTIGSGAFSIVKKACYKSTGTIVALKFLKDVSQIPEREEKNLLREAKKLFKLKHPNILTLVGVILEPDNYCIVTEHMHYGNLQQFLSDCKRQTGAHPSIDIKTKFVCDVVQGMSYLHEMGVLHLDLKSQNVLVSDEFICKIADFGLSVWPEISRSFSKVSSVERVKGTTTHVAPEQWATINLAPDRAQDVYAFGIVVWEILTCEVPFSHVRELERIALAVTRGERPDEKLIPVNTPEWLKDMMKSSWSQELEERRTFKKLLEQINQNKSDGFDDKITKAIEELRPKLQEASPTKSEQTHAQPSGDIEEDAAGVPHPADRVEIEGSINLSGSRNEKVTREKNLPVQRNTTDGGHQRPLPIGAEQGEKRPVQRNTTEVHPVKPSGRGNREPSQRLPTQRNTAEKGNPGGRRSHSPVEVDAVPNDRQGPKREHTAGAGAAKKPTQPQTIVHQHESGARTTIHNYSGAGNIQIGDGNTMHIILPRNGGSSGAASFNAASFNAASFNAAPFSSGFPFPVSESGRRKQKTQVEVDVTDSNRVITDNDINIVCLNIGKKWRELGRQLGFSSGQLDAFSHDNEHGGLYEKIHDMLDKWRKKFASKATAAALADALCNMNCVQIAGKLPL